MLCFQNVTEYSKHSAHRYGYGCFPTSATESGIPATGKAQFCSDVAKRPKVLVCGRLLVRPEACNIDPVHRTAI